MMYVYNISISILITYENMRCNTYIFIRNYKVLYFYAYHFFIKFIQNIMFKKKQLNYRENRMVTCRETCPMAILSSPRTPYEENKVIFNRAYLSFST